MEYPVRINKYLAELGHATRRGADALIEAGNVRVNGTRAVVGQLINEGDQVTVAPAARRTYRYLLYYKPRGIITHSPAAHETDIKSAIAHDHGITDVFPVGRLDKDSEGLMLLTDDGRITKRLLEPAFDHEKEYHVILDKEVTDGMLRRLARGVNIEGYLTKPARASRDPKDPCALSITLTEGKKHQIRRMCTALGFQVLALKRTRILSFTLRPLTPGAYRELRPHERKALGASLGLPLL